MGLLDGLVGSLIGGLTGSGTGGSPPQAILNAALQIVEQHGGIEGMVARFRQAGFADQAQSWIGTGHNLPIDSAAIAQVIGHGKLAEIAGALGLSNPDAAGGLAQALPHLIDRLTPGGQIPANHAELVQQALAMLKEARGG